MAETISLARVVTETGIYHSALNRLLEEPAIMIQDFMAEQREMARAAEKCAAEKCAAKKVQM